MKNSVNFMMWSMLIRESLIWNKWRFFFFQEVFSWLSASGSETAQDVSSGGLRSLFFLQKRWFNYQSRSWHIECHLQLRLPLHQAEGDSPSHVKDDCDQQLPLESQELGVEEGNGTAQTLHELEDGKSLGWFLLERSSKYWGNLEMSMMK